MRAVFDASGDVHGDRPAEIRIGVSLVMVSSADAREPFPAFLYVYVDDVDSTYRPRSVNAGVRAIAVVGFHRCWRWRSVDYSWLPAGRSRDGVVEVPFFLFGRLAGGPLIGLRSIAIET